MPKKINKGKTKYRKYKKQNAVDACSVKQDFLVMLR